MADSANNQEAGGGEGQKQIQPAPPQEAKPAELIKTEAPGAVSGASHTTKAEPIAESKAPENSSLPQQENITAVAVPAADSKFEGKTKDKVEEKKEDANIDKAVIPAEVSTVEVKTEISSEGQVEEKKENIHPDKVAAEEVKVEKQLEPKQDGLTNGGASNSNDGPNREAALLVKIQELEKLKNEKSEDTLRMELKVRGEEIDLLKARVKNLETELQAALSKPGAKNHEMIENIKQQHEELLSKARGMIFDKTKIVKNQELQIEALTTQVQSLKDINQITKDLLEIRNSEIKAMEDRLQVMEARFKTEKERYGLVLQRAQTSSTINDDLKKEYETQLKIFKELRLKYEQKVEALVAENNTLKMDLVKSTGGETSTDAPK